MNKRKGEPRSGVCPSRPSFGMSDRCPVAVNASAADLNDKCADQSTMVIAISNIGRSVEVHKEHLWFPAVIWSFGLVTWHSLTIVVDNVHWTWHVNINSRSHNELQNAFEWTNVFVHMGTTPVTTCRFKIKASINGGQKKNTVHVTSCLFRHKW